jgi:Ca2+-binding RTX toxin-like protein
MAIKPGNRSQTIEWLGDGETLTGGNADDTITSWGYNNSLFGGNAKDTLTAWGKGNLLDGGNGADKLSSYSTGDFFEVSMGNQLTGGLGPDSFSLRNTSDLIVSNNSNQASDVVDSGDTIVGVMDVITDYSAGEMINIGGISMVAPPVNLDVFGLGHQHLVLGDGEYAFIRGTMTAPGQFDVSDDGVDTLLVYDTYDELDQPYLQGAVVLTGVTDTGSIVIA